MSQVRSLRSFDFDIIENEDIINHIDNLYSEKLFIGFMEDFWQKKN